MARWIPVPEANSLEVDDSTTIIVNGTDVALCRDANGYYALSNRCPHRRGQIGDGRVANGRAWCPLHNWDFDLRTGISPYNPNDRLDTYPVAVNGSGVEIDADAVPVTPATGYLRDYQGRYRRFVDDVEAEYDAVQHFARFGEGAVEAMRTTRPVVGFDAVQFRPAQLATLPVLDDEPITLGVTLGAKCNHPLTLSMPVLVSHMSFGALSKEAKIALARASADAGIAICSGEGGMLPEERDNASQYILEMASGYFGWTEENIRRADAIEIKIGQAAKAGAGGLLPGSKVTPEIAKVRGLEAGQTAHSPAHFPDIANSRDLAERVAEIRRMTDGRPVGIKIAASRVEEDLEQALESQPDWITLDGRPGGTGAAPVHLKDHVGIPTIYAVDRARRFFDRYRVRDTDLIVTGGLRTPADFAKAIAMGADAVAIATSAMMAIGCQQYRACHTGNCPVGIATQRSDLRDRFDIDTATTMAGNYFAVVRDQLADYCRVLGKRDIHTLSVEDLVTTDSEISNHTAVEHA